MGNIFFFVVHFILSCLFLFIFYIIFLILSFGFLVYLTPMNEIKWMRKNLYNTKLKNYNLLWFTSFTQDSYLKIITQEEKKNLYIFKLLFYFFYFFFRLILIWIFFLKMKIDLNIWKILFCDLRHSSKKIASIFLFLLFFLDS